MSRASRRVSAALVSVLATVATFITVLAVFANHVLVSPSTFSPTGPSACCTQEMSNR